MEEEENTGAPEEETEATEELEDSGTEAEEDSEGEEDSTGVADDKLKKNQQNKDKLFFLFFSLFFFI